MPLPRPGAGRTAIVTGASSGIGEQFARELARRGHHVTLVARSADALHALADELAATGALVLTADLSEQDDRAALPARISDAGLTPDILINNAGLSTLGPVHESDPGAETNMLEVDVVAVAELCSRFLPGMVARHTGAVLNVASTAAFQPLPGQAGYSAAKAFVLSYTQSLAGELRGTGVTATVLCPGPVETGFGETAGFDQDEATSALPAMLWRDAAMVARDGIDAMARGRMTVIPGALNHVGARLAWLTPRALLVPLVASRHPGLRRPG